MTLRIRLNWQHLVGAFIVVVMLLLLGYNLRKPKVVRQEVVKWEERIVRELIKDTVQKWSLRWREVKPETVQVIYCIPPPAESLLHIFGFDYGRPARSLTVYAYRDTAHYAITYENVNAPFEVRARSRDLLLRTQRKFPLRPIFALGLFTTHKFAPSAEVAAGVAWRKWALEGRLVAEEVGLEYKAGFVWRPW
jgi:hypothetical protein